MKKLFLALLVGISVPTVYPVSPAATYRADAAQISDIDFAELDARIDELGGVEMIADAKPTSEFMIFIRRIGMPVLEAYLKVKAAVVKVFTKPVCKKCGKRHSR